MRTTLILKNDLVEKAAELTKIREKTALVHAGLLALISQASRERLIALGGKLTNIKAPRRRRS